MFNVLVGVICYNEAGTLQQLFDELINVRKKVDFDIIHFDDNSTDGSYEICKKYDLVSVKNVTNKGYSNNVVNALRYFVDSKKYSHIILMDGDLEHDPLDVTNFLMRKEANILLGQRSRKNRWAEKFLGVVFNYLFCIPDPYSGMRMYSLEFTTSFLRSGLNYADGLGPLFHAKDPNTKFCVENMNITVRHRADTARFGDGFFANVRLLKNIFKVY